MADTGSRARLIPSPTGGDYSSGYGGSSEGYIQSPEAYSPPAPAPIANSRDPVLRVHFAPAQPPSTSVTSHSDSPRLGGTAGDTLASAPNPWLNPWC